MNVRRQITGEDDFLNVNAGATAELEEILAIPDEESFKERFAGSPLMRPVGGGAARVKYARAAV